MVLGRVLALLAGLLLLVPAAGTAQPSAPPKTPTATGTGGAAATVEVLATGAAVEALRDGASAVDAAVVAAAVLGVTEPFSCGIGGGGFMLIRTADGKVTTIDHREKAPAAMQPTAFINPATGQPLPFNEARYSGLSAGVPGTVAGWDAALRKYGTMSLGEALEPAIEVARNGFVIDQVFFDQTQSNVAFFADIPSSAALFLDPDGTPRDVGTVFRNPDLARAYARIAHLGAKGFYRGAIADAIVATVQAPPVVPDATRVWRPGLMTMNDLRAYTAPERAPTRVGYRGLDVYGMGPPSSGGSTVGEALNILEGFDLDPADRAQAFHLFLDASRYSFADRNAFVGDPGFVDVPLAGLLSDAYAAQRRALINPAHAAAHPAAPGNPFPFDSAAQGSATALHGETTTHLTVSDRWGNIVSYTYTIESTGGNGIVVPGWGFLLNNELTDFDFAPPAIGTSPNLPDGGKRPRSSMSPTLVLDDGQPLLALGSPGGSMIITTVLQLLLDRLDLDATLPDAIAAPRASQRNTAAVSAEPAFIASPLGQALATIYGHAFATTAEIGAATGIEFLPDGRMLAAAEPTRRGGGSALVVTPG